MIDLYISINLFTFSSPLTSPHLVRREIITQKLLPHTSVTITVFYNANWLKHTIFLIILVENSWFLYVSFTSRVITMSSLQYKSLKFSFRVNMFSTYASDICLSKTIIKKTSNTTSVQSIHKTLNNTSAKNSQIAIVEFLSRTKCFKWKIALIYILDFSHWLEKQNFQWKQIHISFFSYIITCLFHHLYFQIFY